MQRPVRRTFLSPTLTTSNFGKLLNSGSSPLVLMILPVKHATDHLGTLPCCLLAVYVSLLSQRAKQAFKDWQPNLKLFLIHVKLMVAQASIV